MNESPQISISNLRLSKKSEDDHLFDLLNALPSPILIVDTEIWQIHFSNHAACELLNHTLPELLNLKLNDLFDNWNPGIMKVISNLNPNGQPLYTSPFRVRLAHGNDGNAELQLHFIPFSEIEDRTILLIESGGNDQFSHLPDLQEIWKGLSKLADATNDPDLESALKTVLEAGRLLTGSDLFAVYQAQSGAPYFKRIAEIGEISSLPAVLTDQDFDSLNQPNLWVTGNRPSSLLHRIARMDGFTFLASTVLGENNAAIGLLVIGDRNQAPPEYIHGLIKILSSWITRLIQDFISRSETQITLETQRVKLSIQQVVLESLKEGILLIDPELNILEINSAAEMMFGYTNRESKGKPVENIIIGRQSIASILASAQQGSPTYNFGNFRLYKRNGDEISTLLRVVPIQESGKLIAIAVLIQDLSELEEASLKAQLFEQRALLGDATAMFAHEMRNPLNNISSTLQLMLRKLSEDDPDRKTTERMLQDCARLEEQISAVLEISRPSKFIMENLDLQELLTHLVERLSPRIHRFNVQYDLHFPPNCPSIKGNTRGLEEVFSNLINNSIEAMSETGGHLILRMQPIQTQDGRTSVHVAVADTGPGISPEHREHLFKPFFTTKEKGTGLGLAIVKSIVLAHKGVIKVDYYTPGTVFNIYFPANIEKVEET
jgi:two-component system sensor histidine kinase AtoS